MRRRVKRRARLILLGCLALWAGAAGASIGALHSGGADATSLAQRLGELNREKGRLQEKLRGVKRAQQRVTRHLTALDRKLDATETRLRRTRLGLVRIQRELKQVGQEYEAAAERLARHQVALSDRLAALYRGGEVSPVEVLLQSTSFSDFANRLYLLNLIVAQDAELLTRFEESRDEARDRRATLETQASELAALQSKLTSDRRRASAEREATKREKSNLLRDRAAWERALAELEENSREIEGMLQRRQYTAEGQAQLTQPWTGELAWPLKGRISSRFGYRRHPIYRVRKMHTGLDVAAPRGQAVQAAAGGTVVHAARWGGYGRCVIIDHGGGLATLYAHCSKLAVKKDQEVQQGQTIAYVGSTGLATGPHLHFEVRRDGRPIDPMSLLP